MSDETSDLNRRQFIKLAAGTGAGLTLGITIGGCEGDRNAGGFQPNIWLRVAENGRVTVFLAESEMGQGVATALPMLVAEELEVALENIDVEPAPLTAGYGYQITGGSNSVRNAWKPLRQAGAIAREMLKSAAAEFWDIPVSQCMTNNGRVFSNQPDLSLTYGELASAAARQPIPENVELKKREQFKVLGKETSTLGTLDKITGKAIYGSDVALPGLKVAAIRHCPVFGGTLKSFDDRSLRNKSGIVGVVPLGNALAVVADSYWQASRAIDAISIDWDEGNASSLNNEKLESSLWEALKSEGTVYRNDVGPVGNNDSLKENSYEASFIVPFQAHATMEPMCCTARVTDDVCEIWVPTQAPSNARNMASEAAFSGATNFWHKVRRRLEVVSDDPVKVHRVQIGGGFGRRLNNDFVTEAIRIARAIQAPVKLLWSREEDIQHDRYRPLTVHKLKASIDSNGNLNSWSHRFAGPTARPGGAQDLPYAIPTVYVEGQDVSIRVPVGSWRSVSHSYNAFVTECFLDEVAEKAGKDAVLFRLEHLNGNKRLANVLSLAAERAGWFEERVAGRYLGISAHQSFGSFVAQVAEVSVHQNGRIRVHRMVCAMDCGQMINPNTVKAQVEGSIVFGLTTALKSSITISGGRVDQSNFHDFQVLRLNEMPEIIILLVDSNEDPGGVGEPAVPPVAPAVANALYVATGQRQRSQPFKV